VIACETLSKDADGPVCIEAYIEPNAERPHPSHPPLSVTSVPSFDCPTRCRFLVRVPALDVQLLDFLLTFDLRTRRTPNMSSVSIQASSHETTQR
jgi:hypothetical protein